MSEILGGNTIESAIKIDELPLSLPNIMYGGSWKKIATGDDVLGLVFPEVIGKGRVIILYEEPRAAKGMLRVDKAAIATLPKIPPVSTVEDARDMLSEKREDATVINNKTRVPGAKMPWGVQISNFGFITIDAIPLLLGVFDIKDFARKLQHMLEWIQGPVSKIDKDFSSYIINILRHQPGITTYIRSHSNTLNLSLISL